MNNQFEKWLQESGPPVEVNENSKEIHLAVLKQRLRERESNHRNQQKRVRRGSVVVVALMLVLMGGNVSELGSDGFDFVVLEESPVDDMKLVEVGFRKSGLGVPSNMNSEEIEEFAIQAEGRIGVPVDVECINIQGDEIWTINFMYELGGSPSLGGHTVKDRASASDGTNHYNFLVSEYEGVLKKIENGSLSSISSRSEMVDGFRFLIKVYHIQSDQFGLVVYQKGEPIR